MSDDLRSALQEAFASKREEETVVDAAVDTAADTAVEPKQQTTPDDRDERGRFKPKEAAETATQEAPVEVAPEKPKRSAPRAWPDEKKAQFESLPDDIQDFLLKREADVEKGFTKLDDERNFGKRVRDIVNPYMPIIQSEGGTAEAAIQDLLNTAYLLRRGTPEQKLELFRNTARQFGVDLDQLNVSNEWVDPQVSALESRLAQMQHQMEQFQRQSEQARIEPMINEIQAFAATAPHFERVKGLMSALLQNGAADSLKDAYDKACWATPDIRSTFEAEAQEKQRAEAQARIEAAKRASASVTGGPGASIPTNPTSQDRSLRDELMANMRAAAGRA